MILEASQIELFRRSPSQVCNNQPNKTREEQNKIWEVKRIHANALKEGLIMTDVYINPSLARNYAKCDGLVKAQEVIEKPPDPPMNVESWSFLITKYARNGLGHEALKCFKQMQDAKICPNSVIYASVLKACGIVRSLEIGECIDTEVRKQGLLHKDVVLGTALVDMYFKCGALEKAQDAFEQLPVKNVVTWSALIGGYAHHGHGDEALKFFRQMQDARVSPNAVTYMCVLKACGITRSLKIGENVDFEIRKRGLMQKHVALGTALVDMYLKCSALEKAREVFEQLPVRNVVSWSAMINGYVQHGLGHEALKCFREMQDARVHPNAVTYAGILKACGIIGSLEIGEGIDVEIRKQGLLENDVVLGTSLVDMYSKCGALEKAREVFDSLPIQNIVSWNALIGGYVEHGFGEEALKCFKEMQHKGIRPDAVTYICTLKACGIAGFQVIGEDIVAEIRKQGLLQKDLMLGNALVDMYSKCGALEIALEVFEQLPVKNVVSWSILITLYAHLGQANVVLGLYKRMKIESVVPNSVTFIVLLTSCSHTGLIKDGEKLFEEMCVEYSLTPTLEHYTCMIDLFGRAGHFDMAKALLDKVSYSGHVPLFLTILGACRTWRNLKLGRWVFEHLINLNEKCAGAYVTMENLYVEAEMQKES